MADQKISQLTTIATVDNATDLFPIVDTSAAETKKITPTALKTALALNAVDNTADLDKPISTAMQTALNLKQNALGFSSIVASGTQVVLVANSNKSWVVTGSGGQVIKLPDATTLANGTLFYFNNNQSSGAITINNNLNTLIASIPSGGYTQITLLSNSIAAGSWERHEQAPSNVSWSTNTFDYSGSITGATWNGVSIADNRIASAATWNAKQDSVITTNRQTASYSLVLTDASKLVEMNVATANNLTIPLNSSIAFPIGTQILLSQYGAGQTTIVATGGVSVRSSGGKLKLNAQYSGATLIKIATDEWYLFGDIAA